MKTKILALIVILAIAVVSCQKDEKEIVPQDVTFGIEQIDPSGLKGLFDCPVDLQGNLLVPVKAEVIVGGISYFPEVFYLGGKLYTQAIKLLPGTYSVTKFVLLTATNQIVMATPNTGAEFDEYVTPSLPFNITVSAFTKIEIPIDVLCFEEAKYTLFGFFWFQVDEIIIREKCFFGDICVENPNDYLGSYYANQSTGLQIDMPAIFKIHAYKGSVAPANQLPNSPFTNAIGPNWGVGAPVCVKWPDLIRVNNEVFIFELWIYVAVGNGFDYVKFHTWTFIDDALIAQGGVDGIIDFVLGDCNYSATDLQLAWPVPPVINGVIGAGEWDGAAAIPVTGGKGTVYVKVLGDYLYVAMDINDNTDARLGQNQVGNDQVGFNINPTTGGSWGFPYDIIFQTGNDANAWGGISSGLIDGWKTQWSIKVAGVTTQQLSLPAGLESVTLYTNNLQPGGKRITEWKIPLNGVNPVKVGGAIDIGDGNSYAYPIGLNWSDANSFFPMP